MIYRMATRETLHDTYREYVLNLKIDCKNLDRTARLKAYDIIESVFSSLVGPGKEERKYGTLRAERQKR
jgi:hypothetical protein